MSKIVENHLAVIDQLGEVVFQTDADGNWVFLNATWQKVTGFSVEESLGKPFVTYVHPEDREENWRLFEPLINRSKDYCRHEIRYLNKSGGFIWVEVYAILTVDKTDAVIGTSGTIRDITEWRKLNRQKAKNELWFKSVFNSAYQAMMLLSPRGQVIEANLQALNYYKLNLQELKDKSVWELASDPAAADRLKNLVCKAASGSLVRYEVESASRDGAPLFFDVSVNPIKDENGSVILLILEARDVTELKAIAKELRKSLDKEKELNELKSKFVSIASHQFRTPLAGIQSSLDLITMVLSSEQIKNADKIERYKEWIQQNISSMTDLINDVLILEKIDAGKVNVEIRPVDVLAVVQDLVDLHLATGNGGIAIRIEGNARLVNADSKLLRHIFQNILDNAVKYGGESNRISVCFNYREDGVRISLSDQGEGISEEELPHIFQPFFRASSAANTAGTGLGLAIVKQFCDLMNAQIDVKSEEGKGTVFLIYLSY